MVQPVNPPGYGETNVVSEIPMDMGKLLNVHIGLSEDVYKWKRMDSAHAHSAAKDTNSNV